MLSYRSLKIIFEARSLGAFWHFNAAVFKELWYCYDKVSSIPILIFYVNELF